MVADLRLSVGVERFPEDADYDERYAFDADGLAYGRVGGTIELFRERLDDALRSPVDGDDDAWRE